MEVKVKYLVHKSEIFVGREYFPRTKRVKLDRNSPKCTTKFGTRVNFVIHTTTLHACVKPCIHVRINHKFEICVLLLRCMRNIDCPSGLQRQAQQPLARPGCLCEPCEPQDNNQVHSGHFAKMPRLRCGYKVQLALDMQLKISKAASTTTINKFELQCQNK